MPDPASIVHLDYATPGPHAERRHRVMLLIAGLAAAVLALRGCAAAAVVVMRVLAGTASDFRQWYLVWFASLVTGPLLAVCAIAALRRDAIHRAARVRKLFLAAFVLMTAVEGVWDARWLLPRIVGENVVSGWFEETAGRGFEHAATLCLLMPVLLSGVDDVVVWRRRAMLVTAMTIGLCGLTGIDRLLNMGYIIQRTVGGSVGDGIRAALQRPAPIAGMWRLLGVASAGVLFATISQPRRAIVAVAAIAGLLFCFVLANTPIYWVMPAGLGSEWLRLEASAASAVMLLIGAIAAPLWLLVWATSYGKDAIFAEEAVGGAVVVEAAEIENAA